MKIAKMSDDAMEVLRRKAKGHSRDAHIFAHIIACYEILIENACDEQSNVIEWKPEIRDAMEKAGLKP